MKKQDLLDLMALGPVFASVHSGVKAGSIAEITALDCGTPISGLNSDWATEPGHYGWKQELENPVKRVKLRGKMGKRCVEFEYRFIFIELLDGVHETQIVHGRPATPRIKDMFDHEVAPGQVIAYVKDTTQSMGVVSRITDNGVVYVKNLNDNPDRETRAKITPGNFIIMRDGILDDVMLLRLGAR